MHDNALDAHYQPIVELATGQITGYEMLARWTHPQRGPITPDVFVPLAETAGLARALDQWAIRRGIRDMAALRVAGRINRHAHVAINLSAKHLGDPDLEEQIMAVTDEVDVPPSTVTLEITEGAVMHDVAASRRLLDRLRRRGYNIALDDFGTGHSSLAYLRDLPITALKIDRSFVADMTRDEEALAIVTSIIQLAHAVGVTTIAEGVETPEQAIQLATRGCHAAQGWLWSKALPPDQLGEVPLRYRAVDTPYRNGPRTHPPHHVQGEYGEPDSLP